MSRSAEENPEAARLGQQLADALHRVRDLQCDKHKLLVALDEKQREIYALRADFEETNAQLINALHTRDLRIEELCHVQP